MNKSEELALYKKALYSMILSINEIIPLSEQDQVLIAFFLRDSKTKIQQWFEWLRPRIKGENELEATKEEIIRAAVQIDKGILKDTP